MAEVVVITHGWSGRGLLEVFPAPAPLLQQEVDSTNVNRERTRSPLCPCIHVICYTHSKMLYGMQSLRLQSRDSPSERHIWRAIGVELLQLLPLLYLAQRCWWGGLHQLHQLQQLHLHPRPQLQPQLHSTRQVVRVCSYPWLSKLTG